MNREELRFGSTHPWRDRLIEAGLALAIAGVLFGVAAGPAFSQEAVVTAPRTDIIGQVQIPFARASLDQAGYVKQLRGEIRVAARQVCPWMEFRDDQSGADRNFCVITARQDGYAQLDRAVARGVTFAEGGQATILLVARR